MIVYFISLGFVLLMYISQNQIQSVFVGSETSMTLGLRCKLSKAVSVNITSFQLADFQYGQNNDYVEMLNHINQLKNLSNEKQCFHRLVPYEMNPYHSSLCLSATQVISFFNNHKQDLLFRCHDTTTFSHCQQFYLLLYDSKNNLCSSYQRKPCNCVVNYLI